MGSVYRRRRSMCGRLHRELSRSHQRVVAGNPVATILLGSVERGIGAIDDGGWRFVGQQVTDADAHRHPANVGKGMMFDGFTETLESTLGIALACRLQHGDEFLVAKADNWSSLRKDGRTRASVART